ncbi:hypothetical protein NEMBOFW57_008210 [Staphylotrichum longicolle]|uniref:Calcineurin-like phosphoesterase domain-containing protein n=1 Tax=Staphylotrichum longicolle TaxID=669026 RepID=A0AAD4ER17_9PEZI|nr:hypothetical protein NEMBOFW57_008210 [Staphylotrichum longicolle]
MQQPITSIKTQGYRQRQFAAALLTQHSSKPSVTNQANPIRVVCISDTHNHQSELPPGDILLHAGDLTESGSFDEVQAGLKWLSSQPHPFKILIAGNHDVLLDEAFLQRYPERRYGLSQTKQDLDWGTVTHLEDTHITLDVPVQDPPPYGQTHRKVTIYGSPWTPQYTLSAFQYPASTAPLHWSDRLDPAPVPTPDIIVTHGPPKLYLDQRGVHQAGCPYLLAEIAQIRPRLHVFGHIHAAHGREDVVLDAVRRVHDDVQLGRMMAR